VLSIRPFRDVHARAVMAVTIHSRSFSDGMILGFRDRLFRTLSTSDPFGPGRTESILVPPKIYGTKRT
jgi:hypothetical protein